MGVVFYCVFDSPIGDIVVGCNGKGLTDVHIDGDVYFRDIPRDWKRDEKNPILTKACFQLNEYFDGKLKSFDLPIILNGTETMIKVWRFLEGVGYGDTVSYKDIAIGISKEKGCRMVGNAVGRNRLSIVIPCHRVIRSDGDIGGYIAGAEKKKFLLDLEKKGC